MKICKALDHTELHHFIFHCLIGYPNETYTMREYKKKMEGKYIS